MWHVLSSAPCHLQAVNKPTPLSIFTHKVTIIAQMKKKTLMFRVFMMTKYQTQGYKIIGEIKLQI